MSLEILIQCHKDACRKNLNKFTLRTFQTLTIMEAPTILDIGCGSGVPTLELARLCNGKIIGLDIDRFLLDFLEKKIQKAGVSDRLRTVQCSMFELDFPDESFDVIWAEGSIAVIGFNKARAQEVWSFCGGPVLRQPPASRALPETSIGFRRCSDRASNLEAVNLQNKHAP